MQLHFRQTDSRINTLKKVLIYPRREQRFKIFYEAAHEAEIRLEFGRSRSLETTKKGLGDLNSQGDGYGGWQAFTPHPSVASSIVASFNPEKPTQ